MKALGNSFGPSPQVVSSVAKNHPSANSWCPMVKKSPETDSATPLCIIHEDKKIRAELHKDGEIFRLHFAGVKRKDRTFDTLPALLSGLHGVFLELRMGNKGIQGLDGLAKASDDARQDVLGASRKIHSALEKQS